MVSCVTVKDSDGERNVDVSGAYVKNKAYMAGQAAPGGDFPASWPNFGAEALAVAGSRHLAERRFFLGILLLNDPPDRTSAKRSRMTAPSIACVAASVSRLCCSASQQQLSHQGR